MARTFRSTTAGPPREAPQVRQRRRVRGGCPEIRACFNDPMIGAVADRYPGHPNTPNRHITLTDDHVPNDEIISYHFDEIGSLKFLLTWTTSTARTAPSRILGTHRTTSEVRKREWLQPGDSEKIRIRVFDSFSEDLFYTLYGNSKQFMPARALAFTASASAMLIFDTDTLHRRAGSPRGVAAESPAPPATATSGRDREYFRHPMADALINHDYLGDLTDLRKQFVQHDFQLVYLPRFLSERRASELARRGEFDEVYRLVPESEQA